MTVKARDFTQVQLRKATRDRLKALGVKGESFDKIVQALIAFKEAGEVVE